MNFSRFHSFTVPGGEGSLFLVLNVSKGYFTVLFGTEKVIYGNSRRAQIADVAQEVSAFTRSSVSILSQPWEMFCKCELFPDWRSTALYRWK
jgi:hypothetical protein